MIPIAGKKILLIGGAGFIGHHLALKLKELGADVYIMDSLQVNNLKAFEVNQDNIPNARLYLEILHERLELLKAANIQLIEQDARDYHKVCRDIHVINPNVLIQLAAVAHANKSNKDPYSTFDHSLRTLENALDNARADTNDIDHFIYFSSSMVYGHFLNEIVSEDSDCEPLGIYGALKFAGEKLVIAYNQVFDLPYTIIRPSALYGQRCVSRRVGQIFIENALQGLQVIINGDGNDRLDFTYINDLVDGVVKVLSCEQAKNQTFNLTYGQSRSIADMSQILSEHFPNIRLKYQPRDKLTPNRGTLGIQKAKDLIGYDPQWPLEKGFKEYIEWYKKLWVHCAAMIG